MKHNINYSKRNAGGTITVSIDIPDECPVCGRLLRLSPTLTTHCVFTDTVLVNLKCPNPECAAFATAHYKRLPEGNLVFLKIEPPRLTTTDFPEFTKEISPNFISIYREAQEAKERGLLQIAGPGFRKAFEFLIKDYAKSITSPEKHGNIENTLAGNVVANFIPDPRVQAVAKRALWVGNDETHYLRKWETKDINDLMTLMKLTLDWIEIDRASKEYIDDMPDSKPKVQ